MKRERLSILRRQRGFTLIEALVAMFITALGLLSIGLLLTFSTQRVQSSEQLGLATDLAQQGLDMMRSNRLEAFRMVGDNRPAAQACLVAPALENTPEQRRAIWDCRLARALVNPQATWTFQNGIATVRIEWNRDRGNNEDTVIELETRL